MNSKNINNDKRYVPWSVFVWAMGVVLLVMSWMITLSLSNQAAYTKIDAQLSQIQTDITWLKLSLDK